MCTRAPPVTSAENQRVQRFRKMEETEDGNGEITKGGEYSPEFREQAVRTYQESGLSVAEVAKRLSLPKSSLNNWVMAAKMESWLQ